MDGKERFVVVAEIERRYRSLSRGGASNQRDENDTAPAVAETITEAIPRAVSEYHELQVRFVLLVKPGSVLKTFRGKVQRQACRSTFLADSFLRWDTNNATVFTGDVV